MDKQTDRNSDKDNFSNTQPRRIDLKRGDSLVIAGPSGKSFNVRANDDSISLDSTNQFDYDKNNNSVNFR